MTRKEMSEICALLLLAYPNAEVFKGGIQKLAPTIELWTAALPDVDFWTGQQAALKLVKECTFPPSIAEFREKAELVRTELREQAGAAWDTLKGLLRLAGLSPAEAVAHSMTPAFVRQVVADMGGPDSLVKRVESVDKYGRRTVIEKYAYYEFCEAYEAAVRKAEAFPRNAPQTKQIGGHK